MELSNNQKTAIMVFSAALLTFWFVVKPRIKIKKSAEKKPQTASMDGFTEKDNPLKRTPIAAAIIHPRELRNPKIANAYNAMKAYIAAYNAGESLSDIKEMVKDIRRQFGIDVYRKPDGRVAVSDATGQDIMINQK